MGENCGKQDAFRDGVCQERVGVGAATIPEPSADLAKLIELAGVRLPTVFRSRGVKVATRRKLPENRSSR